MTREQDIYRLIQDSKRAENQHLESEYFKLNFDNENRFTIRDKITDSVIVIGDYKNNHLSLATKDEKLNAEIEKSFNTAESKVLDSYIKDAKERKEQAQANRNKDNSYER